VLSFSGDPEEEWDERDVSTGMKSSHDLVPDSGHSFFSCAVDGKVAAQVIATHHQTTTAALTLHEPPPIVQY